MLAFLDNEKHYLEDFYKNILNSKIDIFNLIRLNIINGMVSDKTRGNSLITTYGFTGNLIYNVSGEIAIILLFVIATVILKAGGAIVKN
jgi:hypothetical protein